tara:strand:+ start:88 stop:1212 length:1125 start_codon:yes stop_codon:yes gene_type:complete
MDYKNKYYKYKQKYKNLKKLYGEVKTRSKVVGGAAEEEAAEEEAAAAAAAEEAAAAQGIAAIADAAVIAEAAAPGAPQQNQIRIPQYVLLLFKSTFISNVNDSLKLYLCLYETFNYQLDTQIKIKLLECIKYWDEHVQRLNVAYPHLNFNPILNSYDNLILICIGNLILTASLGLQRFDPVTRNSYLSLDDPEGPTELDCTGEIRKNLFKDSDSDSDSDWELPQQNGGSNDDSDSDSELPLQNREINKDRKILIDAIKSAIELGIADSIKQYLYDNEKFNYQLDEHIDKELRNIDFNWHSIVNTLKTIHPDYNLKYDYSFDNVINVFILNLETKAVRKLEQEDEDIQERYEQLNEGVPTERIVAGNVVRKLDLD